MHHAQDVTPLGTTRQWRVAPHGNDTANEVAYAATMPTRVRLQPDAARHRHYFREWRDWRKLSQDALLARIEGRVSGCSKASLSRIENGLQPYSQDWLEAIAWALDCRPADLLSYAPTDPRAELYDLMSRITGWKLERAAAYLHGLVEGEDAKVEPPRVPEISERKKGKSAPRPYDRPSAMTRRHQGRLEDD